MTPYALAYFGTPSNFDFKAVGDHRLSSARVVNMFDAMGLASIEMPLKAKVWGVFKQSTEAGTVVGIGLYERVDGYMDTQAGGYLGVGLLLQNASADAKQVVSSLHAFHESVSQVALNQSNFKFLAANFSDLPEAGIFQSCREAVANIIPVSVTSSFASLTLNKICVNAESAGIALLLHSLLQDQHVISECRIFMSDDREVVDAFIKSGRTIIDDTQIREMLKTASKNIKLADERISLAEMRVKEAEEHANGHGKVATPDNETHHARFPHPNPDEATSHSTKLPKNGSQVAGYLPEGEGTNERLRKFHIKETEEHVKEAERRADKNQSDRDKEKTLQAEIQPDGNYSTHYILTDEPNTSAAQQEHTSSAPQPEQETIYFDAISTENELRQIARQEVKSQLAGFERKLKIMLRRGMLISALIGLLGGGLGSGAGILILKIWSDSGVTVPAASVSDVPAAPVPANPAATVPAVLAASAPVVSPSSSINSPMYLGIYVSRNKIDYFLRGGSGHDQAQFANTQDGFLDFKDWLDSHGNTNVAACLQGSEPERMELVKYLQINNIDTIIVSATETGSFEMKQYNIPSSNGDPKIIAEYCASNLK